MEELGLRVGSLFSLALVLVLVLGGGVPCSGALCPLFNPRSSVGQNMFAGFKELCFGLWLSHIWSSFCSFFVVFWGNVVL